MNIAITITACRRPEHTVQAIRSAWSAFRGHHVIVSIDEFENAPEESQAVLARLATLEKPVAAVYNSPARGLWGPEPNASFVYQTAFRCGADAIVAIEDDCVLSSDASALVYWFLNNDELHKEYLFLSLANTNRADQVAGRELEVVESTRIDSPWSWVLTRAAWEKIKPEWNRKKFPPRGWDWSLSYSMYLHGWKALCPVLSRARNIGRELGANGGAAWFDENLANAAVSDGTWGDQFQLIRPLGVRALWPWKEEDWMREEIQHDFFSKGQVVPCD